MRVIVWTDLYVSAAEVPPLLTDMGDCSAPQMSVRAVALTLDPVDGVGTDQTALLIGQITNTGPHTVRLRSTQLQMVSTGTTGQHGTTHGPSAVHTAPDGQYRDHGTTRDHIRSVCGPQSTQLQMVSTGTTHQHGTTRSPRRNHMSPKRDHSTDPHHQYDTQLTNYTGPRVT